MFKTSNKENYTKKNNTYYYTKETEIKLSRGEKYILVLQQTFNELNGETTQKIYKERSVLNIRRILKAISKNKNPWKIQKSNTDFEIETYEDEYNKLKSYFSELPSLSGTIENSREEIIRNYSRNTLEKLFHKDEFDNFFYLEGNEPQLQDEGETGIHIGSVFNCPFYRR